MLMGLKLGLKGYFKEITSNNPTKKTTVCDGKLQLLISTSLNYMGQFPWLC